MTAKPRKSVLPDIAKLTRVQAKVELKRLALELEGHDKRYYQEDAPSVTDAEYDALRQRFNAIEARFPEFVTADSPSQKIGAAPTRREGESARTRSGKRFSIAALRVRRASYSASVTLGLSCW